MKKFLGSMFWLLMTKICFLTGVGLILLGARELTFWPAYVFIAAGMLFWLLAAVFAARFFITFTRAVTLAVKAAWKE